MQDKNELFAAGLHTMQIPSSMNAAIENFAQMDQPNKSKFILGDMRS